MKKSLLMALLFCAACVMAEDVAVKSWELTKAAPGSFWSTAVTVNKSCADGVMTVELTQNVEKKNPGNVQYWVTHNNFKAGVKYRADLTIKASKDAVVTYRVMLSEKPWTPVVTKDVKLKANESTPLSIEFTMKEDTTTSYRSPCLFLGLAEPETVFEISNIKLVEVK